jgi:hypothetical protein
LLKIKKKEDKIRSSSETAMKVLLQFGMNMGKILNFPESILKNELSETPNIDKVDEYLRNLLKTT